MDTIKVSFNFPRRVYELMKEEIPVRKRSAYVAKRVEEELKKKRLNEILKKSRGILEGKGPEEWETPESTLKWLRKRRMMDYESIEKLWKK